MKTFAILVSLFTISCAPSPQVQTRSQGVSSSTPLKFDAQPSGLDLPELLTLLEHEIVRSGRPALSVVVELKPYYSTEGAFQPDSSYPDLTTFASKMQQQDTTFIWTVSPSGTLFVRPATGSLLETTLQNSASYPSIHPCEFLVKLNTNAEPNKSGEGGCESRRVPRFLSTKVMTAFDSWKINTSVTSGQTVMDAVDDMIPLFGGPIGFTVFAYGDKLHATWRIR